MREHDPRVAVSLDGAPTVLRRAKQNSFLVVETNEKCSPSDAMRLGESAKIRL